MGKENAHRFKYSIGKYIGGSKQAEEDGQYGVCDFSIYETVVFCTE